MLDQTLKLLSLGYYELQFALEGLAHEHVWKRPAPALLSVGEIAGHMAYWEAIRLAGEGEDLSKCRITSPLINRHFRYYPETIAAPELHLPLTAKQVYEELLRIHEESIAAFKASGADLDAKIPGDPSGFTYGSYLEYAVFHTAYHVGQMYSVRHLLGDQTPDN